MTLSRLLWISRHRARSVFKKDQVDSELHQELAFHFERLVDEFAAGGLSPDQASHAARRAFGNVAMLEEQARDTRGVAWVHDVWQDLLFGLRMLRKQPGFTAVAAASLALGIGASAAVFGVAKQVLRGGLPFPDAGHLVSIRTFPLGEPQRLGNASIPDYFAWKTQSRVVEAIGASLPEQRDLGAEADGAGAERMSGHGVTPGVFEALGVRPALGRVFTDAEAKVGSPAPVIVLSDVFWRRHFGADPNIVNTRVRLNGATTTIIGVMPADFRYPNDNVDYWAPLPLNEVQLQGSFRLFAITARLRDGVTIEQAQADLGAINAKVAAQFPQHQPVGVRIMTLQDQLLGWTRQPLLTFGGAVLLMLLIACANVAGLLLARGSARRSEIAVRLALGAGRGRIIRQFLTEGVLLAVVAGALAVLVAWWGLRGLSAMVPPPAGMRIGGIELDGSMLTLIAALSLLTGLLFGLAPALAAVRPNFTGSLNDLVRGEAAHPRGHRLRGALVAAQIALALVLLLGTGLLLKSVVRLAGRDLNFDPHGLLSFEVRIPVDDYRQTAGISRGAPYGAVHPPSAAMESLYRRLRGIPGAESVAGISLPPVNSLLVPTQTVHLEGRPAPATDADRAAAAAKYFLVTPDFFATMKARLVRGREFEARDTAASPWTAVLNETAARRFWPGENPIGKRFTLDVVSGERPREVVGVVRDIPLRSGYFDGDSVIYTSFLQQPPDYRGPAANIFGQMTFLMRHSGDPMILVPAARRAVADADPNWALARVVPLDWYIVGGWRQLGMSVAVIGLFASVATLLAAIGIYGVMAFAVAQRTRDIGIRMALGASAREVMVLVGGHVLRLVAIGLLTGLGGALAFARLIASQLWEVTPTDPATYAVVSLLLACVALVASYVPLRRALDVDPTVALRYE